MYVDSIAMKTDDMTNSCQGEKVLKVRVLKYVYLSKGIQVDEAEMRTFESVQCRKDDLRPVMVAGQAQMYSSL